MIFMFVIAKTKGTPMREIEKENLKYGDILILKESEPIAGLDKTLEFFKAASKKYDATYYIKADENIYLHPDRLATMLVRKEMEAREYIGCKKIRSHMNIKKDFVFADGSLYILSANAVKLLNKADRERLQRYKTEDVAVGYAMHKAFINLEEQRDLCHSNCTPKFIAVSNFSSCSAGPCDDPITKLKELHI